MLDSNRSPKKSSLKGRNTPPAKPNANRPRAPLVVLGAVMLVIVLSGCASTNVEDYDSLKYNPNTGYPFIGGPFDHSRP